MFNKYKFNIKQTYNPTSSEIQQQNNKYFILTSKFFVCFFNYLTWSLEASVPGAFTSHETKQTKSWKYKNLSQ